MKKWKKRLKILSLYTCIPQMMIMMYGSWDMECNRQNFLSFWAIFCPFILPNNPKNQNFEKMEKVPVDIILLDMCTINENYVMYGSWDMEQDHHFGPFFAFYPLPTLPSQELVGQLSRLYVPIYCSPLPSPSFLVSISQLSVVSI